MQTHRVSPAMTLKSEPAIARIEPPFSSYGLNRDIVGDSGCSEVFQSGRRVEGDLTLVRFAVRQCC